MALFLLKEGEKKGVKWEDLGYPAVKACGNIHGKKLIDLSGTSLERIEK